MIRAALLAALAGLLIAGCAGAHVALESATAPAGLHGAPAAVTR